MPAAPHALWAPWRMEYIRGPKSNGCIFCDYPALGPSHFREHLILCARPHAFVIINRYPFAAGHIMVVPRRHISDLVGLDADEYHAVFDLVRDATTALRTASNAEGVNIGMNLGAAAGAGIAEHLHVHLVPRWKGDTNFMPVLADVRVMPESLDDLYVRLLPYFVPLGSLAAVPSDAETNETVTASNAHRSSKTPRARKGTRR